MACSLLLCGYERISDDPDNTHAGVERQHSDIERIAAGLNAEVCWHRDNDKSAFLDEVVRNDFELMLQHVGDPKHPSRGMLGYDLDRVFRRGDDLQRALKLYKKDETLLFRMVSGEINLSTVQGRLQAELMVAFAYAESAAKQRRLRSWHFYRALAGKPSGPAPFGWQSDNLTLHPVEGPLLRAAAYDVLRRHRSCGQVARDWNAAGVRTRPRRPKLSGGGRGPAVSAPWTARTVTQALKAPGVGGFQVYRKELMYSDGEPVRSLREPVMEAADWFELRAYLDSAERGGGTKNREDNRRYMATSVLRCGGCRYRLTGHSDKRVERHNYECPGHEGRGCGQTRIDGPDLDAWLNEWVEGALELVDPGAVAVREEPWPGEEQLAEARARHADALAEWTGARPSMFSRQTQVRILQGLEETLERLLVEQAAHQREQASAAALAEATDLQRWRAAYAAQDWVECRKTLAALILEVNIKPAPRRRGRLPKGTPRFDETRVEVVARERF